MSLYSEVAVDDYEKGCRVLIKSLEQQERMRNMNR